MLVTTPYYTLIQHDIYIAINTFKVRKRHAIYTGLYLYNYQPTCIWANRYDSTLEFRR